MPEFGYVGTDEEIDECRRTYHNDYDPLEYLTNNSSLLATISDKYSASQIRDINELQLSKYYDFKKPIMNTSHRRSSVLSSSDTGSVSGTTTGLAGYNVPMERFRSQQITDHFLNCSENKIDPYQLNRILNVQTTRDMFQNDFRDPEYMKRLALQRSPTGSYEMTFSKDRTLAPNNLDNFSFSNCHSSQIDNDNEDENENNNNNRNNDIDSITDGLIDFDDTLRQSRDMVRLDFANSYRKYYRKLLTIYLQDFDLLKRHNLWVPIIRDDCKELLVGSYGKRDDIYHNKTCPLFIKGLDYIPTVYDTFSGCSIMRSVFSEFKFPALIYHCSIEFDKHIYMMGGLMPCYRYDAEAPDLERFYVDGIKNLPPPLLSDIVNNPGLVNNPHLYVYSIESSRLSRAIITGQFPPPLLCMTASKLTDRHIFFYGGFEIKTETRCDKHGNYYLKRRAFLNNTVYILDTSTLHFDKIEIVAQSYQHVRYPTLFPRFGHMQVSTTNVKSPLEKEHFDSNGCSNQNTPASSTSEFPLNSKNMTARGSTRIYGHPSNHCVPIATIVIFGGYRQTGDDKYEAMNDMWKLDVKVTGRGKRNFLQFADVVTAVKIPIVNGDEKWPSKRAFFAYNIPPRSLFNKQFLESKLLQDLKHNFRIEFSNKVFSSNHQQRHGTDNKVSNNTNNVGKSSTPLFPNIHKLNNINSKGDDNVNGSSRSKISVNEVHSNSQSLNSMDDIGDKRGRTIIVHGGSNNKEVYGDMWWFDLDKSVWTKVDTYAATDGKQESLVEEGLRLVGHSMTTIGYMAVFAGGLNENDVVKLCKSTTENSMTTLEEDMIPHIDKPAISESAINIIDLSTQCFQGIRVHESENTLPSQVEESSNTDDVETEECHHNNTTIMSADTKSKSHLVLSVGGSTVESDGTVFLIGGLAARRQNIDKLYLRGALLEFVLPSMSLAS